jgi:nitrogen regulatory protein PII-like uncharacterized protein
MMWPKMKREEFENMSIEELAEWAFENVDYVHHEDALIELAKHEIDEENLNVAIHILTGIYESEEAVGGYYIYDRCMGTLEEVVPLTCKEDLEEYIDFEEDEEERATERREAIEETLQQWHDNFCGGKLI